MKIDKDAKLIAEAYTKVNESLYSKYTQAHLERGGSIADQGRPGSNWTKDLDPDGANNREARAKVSEWYKEYLPYGYRETNKNTYVGNDNGREFVTWFIPNEGEMTYDYYLVYKDEGKKHWIDEEIYNKLTNK